MGEKLKGVWLICVNSYILENGTEIPRGRMDYSYAQFRQACAPNWRRATEEEIEGRQYFKGHAFNLNLTNH